MTQQYIELLLFLCLMEKRKYGPCIGKVIYYLSCSFLYPCELLDELKTNWCKAYMLYVKVQ